MSKKGFLLLLFLFPLIMFGQDKWNFKTVDSVTYSFYERQQWDALVDAGKKALHAGVDYYYLRMRLGIARYMQNKPAFAIPHFRKALRFSKNDPVALSYLYGSYLQQNNLPAADQLVSMMPISVVRQLKIEEKTLQNVDISSGYKTNNNMAKSSSLYLMGQDSISGKQLLLKDQWYGHLGVSLRFRNALSLYLGYDRLIINKTNRFQYSEASLKRDSTLYYSWGYENYFSDTVAVKEQSFDTKIIQNNIYLNAGYQWNNGFSIGGFLNAIPIKSQKINQDYRQVVKTDTAYFVEQENRYETFEYSEDNFTFSVVDTSFLNYVAGIWLQKSWGFLSAGLEVSVGNLNDRKQKQVGVELFYYPLGNLNLYGETKGTLLNETGLKQKWVWSQKLGLKLLPQIWIEGEYRFGDLSDTQFSKGFVVYNLPETTNFFTGLNLMYYPGKHINLNLRYQYVDQNGTFATYSNDKKDEIYNTFNYQSNNLILELIWKF